LELAVPVVAMLVAVQTLLIQEIMPLGGVAVLPYLLHPWSFGSLGLPGLNLGTRGQCGLLV
jgi:hypothetical protein